MYTYAAPHAHDANAIEALLDIAFGPGRLSRTSYRFRDGVAPVEDLALTAWHEKKLVGTIAYWPVRIGGNMTPALLLGPVAVEPSLRGQGIGVTLIRRTLAKARRRGHRVVVLVGDKDYYERFGFSAAEPHGISMPGQAERLMVKALLPGALDGVSGDIISCRKGAGTAIHAA